MRCIHTFDLTLLEWQRLKNYFVIEHLKWLLNAHELQTLNIILFSVEHNNIDNNGH